MEDGSPFDTCHVRNARTAGRSFARFNIAISGLERCEDSVPTFPFAKTKLAVGIGHSTTDRTFLLSRNHSAFCTRGPGAPFLVSHSASTSLRGLAKRRSVVPNTGFVKRRGP